jgi:glycosyltransferase involved in cell wall biosynthesis
MFQLFADLRRSIDVDLLCLDSPGPHRSLSEQPGVTVAGPLVFPTGILTLSRALRSSHQNYDVFQILDPYFALPAAYLARVFPRVVCLGMDPAGEMAGRYGPAAGAVVAASLPLLLADAAVVANSHSLASMFPRYSPVVIPNGVDIGKFEHLPPKEEARRLRGLPAEGTLLSFVAKVIPAKRLEWVLDVVRRLPETRAVVVGSYTEEHYGDRYYRELEAAYPDIWDRVTFTGEVPWDHVPSYLAASDVFLHPSVFEGQPNSVLEAMAAGLPAVVSDIAAHREIIRHGETGFLADRPEAMARFVDTLARDPGLRSRVGASARKHVFEHFSAEASAKGYLDLYRSLVER